MKNGKFKQNVISKVILLTVHYYLCYVSRDKTQNMLKIIITMMKSKWLYILFNTGVSEQIL